MDQMQKAGADVVGPRCSGEALKYVANPKALN